MNLVSALLLHPAEHAPDGHVHQHSHQHHDHNIRGAYLHVLADALTSALAIVALAAGWLFGWTWLDPLVGLLGAVIIGRWSLRLMKDSGAVLLDATSGEISGLVRAAVEATGDRIVDLHVWRVGPGHHAAILSVVSPKPRPGSEYRSRLAGVPGLCHLTVEVLEPDEGPNIARHRECAAAVSAAASERLWPR